MSSVWNSVAEVQMSSFQDVYIGKEQEEMAVFTGYLILDGFLDPGVNSTNISSPVKTHLQ